MQASRDENSVPTLLGSWRLEPSVPIRIQVNASNHRLSVQTASNGSGENPENAPRDENDIPVLIATSSDDDVTPVVVYASQMGQLLIDRN